MPTLFNIDAQLPPDDVELLQALNQEIERLAAMRPKTIEITGVLLRSKIAWKVATYTAPMMYRLVMLTEGCALAWNARNTLTCYLTARATLETVAILLDFEHQLTKLIEAEDIAGINALVMNRSFSSRDADWIAEYPDMQAVNILTLVDKLDTRIVSGLRGHYDRLSEICHPNSFGHHQFFGRLDTKRDLWTYSEEHPDRIHGHQSHILGGVAGVALSIGSFDRIEQLLNTIAELQERFPDSNPSHTWRISR
jgi:hypothetical protein